MPRQQVWVHKMPLGNVIGSRQGIRQLDLQGFLECHSDIGVSMLVYADLSFVPADDFQVMCRVAQALMITPWRSYSFLPIRGLFGPFLRG